MLAATVKPSPASIATAMLPTPPVAPVTSTVPASGVMPWSSSASTDSAAVYPAVPISIDSRAVSPSGSGTIQPAGTRATCAYPPWCATPRS